MRWAEGQVMLTGSLLRWLVAALAAGAVGSSSAQAFSGSRRHSASGSAYHSGKYYGTIKQASPKAYVGKIHFLVRNGKISHITFTVKTMCGSVLSTVVREGRQLQSLAIRVKRDGSFAYRGLFKQRHIRFKGRLSGHTAQGTLFESFPTGTLICSMGKPASFTATH